ncbi:RagB/SusD family nutrient uptake outer membrane protein [Cellulophaga omnivescoria]|uniref:RagB/SusD family nutrient uptake outer membrane protein n=1 Tax=Cellulophaga omnivescoria TaxID=1888890 RepID=UPI000987021F|nr:RagB/SusD family nutrient uptake outer membrane protein [Cellulophaga omnivescoria]
MKKYIYKLHLCLFSIFLISCSDFLEKEPHYSLNENNAITDFNKAEAAIGGIYSTIQKDTWAGKLYNSLASKSGFVNWYENNYSMQYSQLNASTEITEAWENFYITINAVNFAIDGIENLPSESIPNEQARKALIAEAKCMRAWTNSNILWNFGHWWSGDDDPYGLLYRDEVVNLSNVEKARLSVGESYIKIFEDLDYAIENLPNFTTPRHLSKEFAKVLKAKIILYRSGYNNSDQDLNLALNLVQEVLENSPSNFSMEPDMGNVYKESWDSKENLFAMYLENNSSRAYTSRGYSYYIVYRGNSLPLATGATLDAGLNFGADWFTEDPRWDIVTGDVRAPETWDDRRFWAWKKLARLGMYEGQQNSEEKYATYYFRYPELFLMKAELLARTGASIQEAIAPINEMRAQRTNPTLPSVNPINRDELMDSIFKEYFFELFLENGSEFFAAARFRTNGKRWIEVIKKDVPFLENKLCWPIPDAEIISNVLMEQNPDLN